MLRLVLDMLGVAVFAISGALAAGRKQLDLIGVVVLGAVTGVGGGTLRDLLLDRNPVFWIAQPTYILVCIVASLGTFLVVRKGHPSRRRRRQALLVADGLGLAFFSISGAQIAQTLGHGPGISILMGAMTGVAGGAIRDVLAAEIPIVMRQGELYATAAAVGAALYLLLDALGVPRGISEFGGMSAVAALRFAALRWRLVLPALSMAPDDPPMVDRPPQATVSDASAGTTGGPDSRGTSSSSD